MGTPRTPKGRAAAITAILIEDFPVAICELEHRIAFELLSATILSAQCTDVRVNQVTPALFAKYPTPQLLAAANPEEIESIIHSTGFFRAKARSLIGMAHDVETRFGGEVPSALEDLVTLPGVGRKTGNVVRSVVFDLPGLPVDTHVMRLSNRLGLTTEDDPVKIEMVLNKLLPPAQWGGFSLRLILHGRRTCAARAPKCGVCSLAHLCPSKVDQPPVARNSESAAPSPNKSPNRNRAA